MIVIPSGVRVWIATGHTDIGSMKPEGRRKTMGGGPEIPLASMVKGY